MKKISFILVLAMSMGLMSCSGDEGNVDVVVSSSPFPLIPATAVSCLAKQNAGSDTPTADISPSYFRIPTITFNRKNTSNTLVIAFIRITIPIPGSTAYSCEIGGDALAALNSAWAGSTTKEAVVPAGEATFSTNCALYCGGISASTQFTASGTMEIFGLERDADLNEYPVKAQTMISVQSY